ncbi:DNA topoisomerase I [Niastella koreensis]|uniref:DNA topoisomerase n=3 Tax=Niastella koreensis TaxID=354356 RepID=G8TNZ5_NIAKG|nr:DNA topoisomerase [Niastella koreensis GR20-10]OQP48767.1 DNA topoisomerase I [Niastella koreensis]
MGQLAKVTHRQYLKINRDYAKAATLADLVYVSDGEPGIVRTKKGKGYMYAYAGKVIRKKEDLKRIRSLAIPPSWTSVWICTRANGHIQATGLDLRNRKQYRYHPLWSVMRNETKFHRMAEFGKALPALRQRLESDLSQRSLTASKVIATVVSLMAQTYIRVGSGEYEKQNGSHGLTTLKDKHVVIAGDTIKFSFKGKKGVSHNITLKSKRLARIVKNCREIPGAELFQYYDDEGHKHPIDSGMINSYIKETTGSDFTSKDFRTWAGSINLLRSLQAMGEAVTQTEQKKNIVAALDEVSLKLGNTRTVCKKYYVHPGLIALYEENSLNKYLKKLEGEESPETTIGLHADEQILMKILQSFHKI